MPEQQNSLFTIIMEYRGGTYIAQITAPDPESALKQWALQINPIDIAHFAEARKTELVHAIDEWREDGQSAVAITGTLNVWCHTETIGGFQMLVNVVATKRRIVPSRAAALGS